MRKYLFLAAALLLAAACDSDKPAELYVPKNTVEFAGNAFTDFSLGADVKLYSAQNPDNKSEWVIQAVVPVRKETKNKIGGLEIDLIPLDDRGIRVRDGFVMHGEDLDNMVPVYNAGDAVERSIVFSVSEDGRKKYFSGKEAAELIARTKGVRMDFNISNPTAVKEEASATPSEYPMTLDGQCRRFGVYGMLSQYDNALKNGNKKRAKQIEDRLWEIEKRVKNDHSIPSSVRDAFVRYVEDKEDEIEDRY